MTVDIICADAREGLARFPDGHFHCCVTSPPFWGLRDYGLEPAVWGGDGCEHEWGEAVLSRGQSGGDGRTSTINAAFKLDGTYDGKTAIKHEPPVSAFCRRCNAWRGTLGLEPTPELYVEHLVSVLREVRRVLRDDGTLWLNLGDSYAASPGQRKTTDKAGPKQVSDAGSIGAPSRSVVGLKPKDLVGIPWMVAFALRADGWWLRSDIIWSKPNPMPESVRDRPTRSHEYLFLLTKSQRYYYDQDAIREPNTNIPRERERPNEAHNLARSLGLNSSCGQNPAGRNRRSVWEIATQPYPDAHFATFPEKLVEPCILTTSEWGCCPECGAPWERVVERKAMQIARSGNHPPELRTRTSGTMTEPPQSETTGWRPTCKHEAEPVPCRVLDPFAGSGTVGVVAERLGRHSVLIDAKEEYCEMARHRTAQMGLMAEAYRE